MLHLLLAAAIAATPTQARAAVLAELKDPDSARITGVKPLLTNGKVTGYCGRVNAKNSFGGYTGDSVFYVSLPARKVVILPPELSEPNLC
jgi:hypothetical protein